MRRDYVTLHVDRTDDGEMPTIALEYDGPDELLTERLGGSDEQAPTAEEIDVAYRHQTSVDVDEPTGVFSLTDRLTGEYILEANAAAASIRDLISAARGADESGPSTDGWYRIELSAGDESWSFEKRTLLVYDDGGSLLRQHSLIPSGVEL